MKSVLFALALTILPGAALAQSSAGPGSGTDLQRVQREMEQMMRDGRYQRLLDEGRANKEAFERLRQQEAASSTVASPRSRRRP
ncbi:MAG TPA: hypothetical protein VIL09_03150 [Microvirga sp.]|jgi:hypothetical protein